MNVRHDMIRSQGMPHMNQNMLGMNPQLFPSQQAQNGQPPHNQHQNIGIATPINHNMAFLPASQSQAHSQAYQMHLAQMQDRRRMIPQSMPAGPNNTQSNHIGPLTPNQIPGGGFPGNMGPGSQGPRRVASQPNMGPGAIHTSQQAMANMAGLNMNVAGGSVPGMQPGVMPGQSMNHPMRPGPTQSGPTQHQPLSLRQPPQQPMPGQMSPGQSIGLVRSGSIPGGMIGPNVGRNPGAQAGMLAHPQMQQGQPHPPNMQPGMQQHPFPGSMGLPQQQQPIGSPSRSSHGHATPSLGMQPQDPNRPPLTAPDANMFNFSAQQFPMTMNPSSRMPAGGANQFPLGPSSTPPGSNGDLSQGPIGPPGPPGPPGFTPNPTPAQKLAQMHQGGTPEGYQPSFSNMPPPHQTGPAPPRPPSSSQQGPRFPPHQPHQSPIQPQHPTPQHMSPHHLPDQMNGHVSRPPRPQSSQPPTPGRPPSQQAGPSRTPHVPHSTLPPDATLLQGRPANIGAPPPPHHIQPLGPMPPGQPPTPHNAHGHAPSSSVGPVPPLNARGHPPPQSASSPPEGTGVVPRTVQPPGHSRVFPAPLGQGQATLRMLQLSGMLSMDVPEKLQLSYWGDLIDSFFVPSAVVKLQLWKDNQNAEAKIFEVGTPILPRFFLVTTQSGVKSMSLTLDGAREVVTGPNLVVVEVVSAVWTYKYQNGYTITLRGPLSAQMCFVSPPNGASVQSLAQPHAQLKIAGMSFSSEKFEKFISFDAIHGQLMDPIVKTPRLRQTQAPINGVLTPAKAEDEKWEEPRMLYERATIPAEPVNAFGIPQATMRCLELAESVAMMGELISFAAVNKLGPRDALKSYAQGVREQHGPPQPGGMPDGASMQFSNPDGSSIPTMHSLYPPPTPTSTSMPGAPGAPPPPGASTPQNPPPPPAASLPSPAPSITKPKNTSKLANAPNPAAGSTAAQPSSATSTPALAATTLKRKAQSSDTASPTTASSDQPPPAKRTNRKRARQSAS